MLKEKIGITVGAWATIVGACIGALGSIVAAVILTQPSIVSDLFENSEESETQAIDHSSAVTEEPVTVLPVQVPKELVLTAPSEVHRKPEIELPAPGAMEPDSGSDPMDSGRAIARSASRSIYEVISLEDVENAEKTKVPFPSPYFRGRLAQELGGDLTTISNIRLGVAFIEPYESRAQATGGTIIGHILVSLPDLTNCTREFGTQAYSFSNAETGIKKAINEYASRIASWIRRASLGEKLTCPTI